MNFVMNCSNSRILFLSFVWKDVLKISGPKFFSTSSNSQKTIKVAVLGVPNAGKSTFINNLINHRVCPTSSKVHTTRKANKAIFTFNDTQVVLFDTPGLVTKTEIKKHNLESSFISSPRQSIQNAGLITVIHDVSNSWTRNELHSTVLDSLKAYPKVPSVLVLNKIDTLKSKRFLLELIKTLTNNTLVSKSGKISKKISIQPKEGDILKPVGWNNFSEVFMVSSLTGSGLPEVLKYIINQAQPQSWDYSSDVYSDEAPENLIVNSVKARLLDYMPQEIPYSLKSQMEYFSDEKNAIYASVQIACPNERIEKLLCGVSNGKLKQITERVTSDLVETFRKPISLTIATIVRKPIENK